MEKLCRTCLRTSEYSVPIFNPDDSGYNLIDIIEQHLPIQVTARDVLPLQLCYKCASILLSWQELLSNCVKSDKFLRSSHDFLENEFAKGFNGDCSTEEINCQYAYKGGQSNDLNFNSFHEAQKALRDPIYFAHTCLERLESSALTNGHKCKNFVKHEEKVPSDITDKNENYDLNDFDIDATSDDIIIEKKSSNKNDSIDRKIGHKLSIATVHNVYKAVYNFKIHFEKLHGRKKDRNSLMSISDLSSDENDEFLCDESKDGTNDDDSSSKYDDLTINNRRRDFFDASTREALGKAKTLINGKIYYICPICGKDLRSTHTYIFHMRIHSGEKPCICHLCGKQFRVNAGLQRHVKETHQKIKMHACDTCGRSFVNRQNLIQHLRIHTGERPFVCSQCGKRFKQSGSLYIHSKTHSDHYPFQCNTCDAKFRQRSGLTHHMYKHTGEKPNVCSFCGKAYRVKHELNIHMLMHTDQRPYICPVCGFAFRQRRTMRNHCKKMHDCDVN